MTIVMFSKVLFWGNAMETIYYIYHTQILNRLESAPKSPLWSGALWKMFTVKVNLTLNFDNGHIL
jgi:hypothetical protein